MTELKARENQTQAQTRWNSPRLGSMSGINRISTQPTVHDINLLIRDLQDPGAYQHHVETVQVVQTHVSCVFLTGRYAYKVKKPVSFSFLDYSTVEQRRRYCGQELELNGRLCPETYVDVVPIVQESGRMMVDGDGNGEPAEWAVRMHQLRGKDMLPARLRAGTLGYREIDRIARAIAKFHSRASAPIGPDELGSPDAIAATTAAATKVMAEVARDFVDEGSLHDILDFFETFESREEQLFRKRQGWIRDCHGDLRLQNICLDERYDNGLQIFDCIEFNAELRFIDAAADLAYLAMDLDLAGRADLRRRLVDTYAAISDDLDLHRILPYYQTYRAIVRANIAALAAEETELGESNRMEQRQIAAAAYELARSYSCRRAQPALIITAGFSGSGKSSLAKMVCSRLPAVYLSSDRIRRERYGVLDADRIEPEEYTPANRAAVYTELRRRARIYLEMGESVVMDATFLSPAERDAAADIAAANNVEFWILECTCPVSIIRERLNRRCAQSTDTDAGIKVLESQLGSYAPISLPARIRNNAVRHLVMDTYGPMHCAVTTALNALLHIPGLDPVRQHWRAAALFGAITDKGSANQPD